MPYGVVALFGCRTVRGSARSADLGLSVLYGCGDISSVYLFALSFDNRACVVYDDIGADSSVKRYEL